jgi:hypothetical protein
MTSFLASSISTVAAPESANTRLRRQIDLRIGQLWPRSACLPRLLAVLERLETRLLDAGFERQAPSETRSRYNRDSGRYKAMAWSIWRHPGCDIPFRVRLALTIFTSERLRGTVSGDLRIFDEQGLLDEQGLPRSGVLSGCGFMEEFVLAGRDMSRSALGWEAHVCRALDSLKPQSCDDIFAMAESHLQRVTTP